MLDSWSILVNSNDSFRENSQSGTVIVTSAILFNNLRFLFYEGKLILCYILTFLFFTKTTQKIFVIYLFICDVIEINTFLTNLQHDQYL